MHGFNQDDRQGVGKPITARRINALIAAVAGLLKMNVGRGLALSWINGAPQIRATGGTDGENLRFAITTTIPARTSSTVPSSGTATISDWTGSAWVDRPTTVTLYNMWKDAIPTNAIGRAVLENGSWFAVVWNCTGG